MAVDEIGSVTVVGAGQASVQAIQSLRKRGFDGTITVIGDEGYAPYQRPPLSKAFLKDEMAEARLSFKPNAFYDEQKIDCRFGAIAADIDTAARVVTCRDESTASYDRLILATGASPISLPVPGVGLEGVFELRGIDDSKAIRHALEDAGRLVVIGGGYIGLEVASAARQLDREVTVVERLPRLLSRVTSPPISEFYLDLHREHGVDVRLEDSVVEIVGASRVAGVRLESGASVEADVVLVGVGVRPNQQLADAAGIACDDGILIDDHCRTSDPYVFAAGDCARLILPGDKTLRLESVHNALVQAEHIAAEIVGDASPPFDPPWFWSDQYDVKLQTVGLFNDHDDIVVRGDITAKKFSALYFQGNALIAIDAVNDPVSFMSGKRILKAGGVVQRGDVEDPAVSLKDLVAR